MGADVDISGGTVREVIWGKGPVVGVKLASSGAVLSASLHESSMRQMVEEVGRPIPGSW